MNVNILHNHQNVSNRAVHIDLTTLEETEQKPEVNQALQEPLSQEEIKAATTQMKKKQSSQHIWLHDRQW